MATSYNSSYEYFNIHFLDWKRPSYRLWWFLRAYLEIVITTKLPKNSKILSVGSGIGQLEYVLEKYFKYKVYLTDISSYAKKLNKKIFNSHNYLVTGADKLPYPDDTFDLVISYDLLEHIDNIDLLNSIICEMKRVSKKKNVINMLHKITVAEEKEIDKDITHKIKWSTKRWAEWFEEHQLFVVKKTSHYLPSFWNKRITFTKELGMFYLSLNKPL